MLRGLHDTRVPMLFAAFGYWGVGLALGVGLAFGFGWKGVGIWIGLASGLAVVAALMLERWVRRERLGLVDGERATALTSPPRPRRQRLTLPGRRPYVRAAPQAHLWRS